LIAFLAFLVKNLWPKTVVLNLLAEWNHIQTETTLLTSQLTHFVL